MDFPASYGMLVEKLLDESWRCWWSVDPVKLGFVCCGKPWWWFGEGNWLMFIPKNWGTVPTFKFNELYELYVDSCTWLETTNLAGDFSIDTYVHRRFFSRHDKDPGSLFTASMYTWQGFERCSFGETEFTPQNITGQINHRVLVHRISKRMWISINLDLD